MGSWGRSQCLGARFPRPSATAQEWPSALAVVGLYQRRPRGGVGGRGRGTPRVCRESRASEDGCFAVRVARPPFSPARSPPRRSIRDSPVFPPRQVSSPAPGPGPAPPVHRRWWRPAGRRLRAVMAARWAGTELTAAAAHPPRRAPSCAPSDCVPPLLPAPRPASASGNPLKVRSQLRAPGNFLSRLVGGGAGAGRGVGGAEGEGRHGGMPGTGVLRVTPAPGEPTPELGRPRTVSRASSRPWPPLPRPHFAPREGRCECVFSFIYALTRLHSSLCLRCEGGGARGINLLHPYHECLHFCFRRQRRLIALGRSALRAC